jgi:hypothetical protein
MPGQISKQLKILFLIHFFVSIIIGLVFLIFVESFTALIGWPNTDPVAGRLLGASLLGYSTSSLLAWRETEWLKVKLIVQMEIVFCAVGSIVLLICVFIPTFALPFFTWVFIVLLLFFLIVFVWFYFQQEKA